MYASDVQHPDPGIQKKLSSLYNLRDGPPIDLKIRQDYLELLDRLGAPQKKLPPVIHVAGTNGKGSVIAYLRAILEAAGLRVHIYSSPHLEKFNERIVLAGTQISDDRLAALLDEVITINKGLPLTFFEITTALAFYAFANTPADIVLLETGMGGRDDCTNIIDKPLLTVITKIGMDHMEFLGAQIEEIAEKKAGIMKPGVPCVIGAQDFVTVYDVFKHHASMTPCELIYAPKEWPADFSRPGLQGAHQSENALSAIACIPYIQSRITRQQIQHGLVHASWPGRLQRITSGKYVDMLSPGSELWFDGGHNESAGRALAKQAAIWAEQDNKPLHLILGMMKTKDIHAFITPLIPFLSGIYCLDIPGEELAYSDQDLAVKIRASFDAPVVCAGNLQNALNDDENNAPCRYLLCGSLYLAKQVLSP